VQAEGLGPREAGGSIGQRGHRPLGRARRRGDDRREEAGDAVAAQRSPDLPQSLRLVGQVDAECAVDLEVDEARRHQEARDVERRRGVRAEPRTDSRDDTVVDEDVRRLDAVDADDRATGQQQPAHPPPPATAAGGRASPRSSEASSSLIDVPYFLARSCHRTAFSRARRRTSGGEPAACGVRASGKN
jgi:hypothetical protein